MNEGPMDKVIKAAKEAQGEPTDKIETDSDFEDALNELVASCDEISDGIEEDPDYADLLEKVESAQETLNRMHVYLEGKIE